MKKLFVSRREFLGVAGVGIGTVALYGLMRENESIPPLRPPGIEGELEFATRCLRCQECVRGCLTLCLEPAGEEYGASKLWTPRFNPELARCEFELCGRACAVACPADLLSPVPDAEVRLGEAFIDKKRCITWDQGKDCLICYERCRYQAVGVDENRRPYMIPENCTGCGACQNTCIAVPAKAIIVYPLGYVPSSEGAGNGGGRRGN
jgi:ferredoxin-type protein NapG